MAFKVLAADSSPSALEAIQMAFQDSEYDVFTCQDGMGVMDFLPRLNPDAVVLGLSLDKMDGYELAGFIKSKKQFRSTPLILLKSAYEPLDEERLKKIGYDDIFQEPFDSEVLTRKIRVLIAERKTPTTLPEEPVGGDDQESRPKENTLQQEIGTELKEQIRALVKKEMLEFEEKLKNRILTWLRSKH